MKEFTPGAYRAAKPFLDRLNSHRDRMSSETYLSIKSLALHGHTTIAKQWLRLVLEKKVK